MKRIVSLLLVLSMLLALPFVAQAYDYDDETLPQYRVISYVADKQLYMYPVAGSSGNPICAYKVGTILRVIEWYVSGSDSYCYAIGPDGNVGYVSKRCMLKHYDYDSVDTAVYTVSSPHYEGGAYRLYMYARPNSSYEPITVVGYVNGEKLKIIDWYCDNSYCFAVGPDNYAGFVPKKWMTYSSGTLPSTEESKDVSEYCLPGTSYLPGAQNAGSGSSGGSSSGGSSSGGNSGSSSGGSNGGSSGGNSGSSSGGNNGGSTYSPFTASASSYYYQTYNPVDPSRAIDSNSATSWDAYGEYAGAWYQLTSNSGPITISGFTIQNGKSTSGGTTNYYRNARIRNFSLYVDGVYVCSGTLRDTNAWQTVSFWNNVRGTTFRLYVDSVYGGTGTPIGNYGVCITEIALTQAWS